MTKKEFAAILEKNFAPRGFKIYDWGKHDEENVPRNDNKWSREVLGLKYRPFEETLIDAVESLVASGKVKEPMK